MSCFLPWRSRYHPFRSNIFIVFDLGVICRFSFPVSMSILYTKIHNMSTQKYTNLCIFYRGTNLDPSIFMETILYGRKKPFFFATKKEKCRHVDILLIFRHKPCIIKNAQTMIGNNIRKIRKQKNITQKILAQKSNVGRSTIAEIENGTHIPRVDIALEIAAALGVPVGDIFYLKSGGNDHETKFHE